MLRGHNGWYLEDKNQILLNDLGGKPHLPTEKLK